MGIKTTLKNLLSAVAKPLSLKVDVGIPLPEKIVSYVGNATIGMQSVASGLSGYRLMTSVGQAVVTPSPAAKVCYLAGALCQGISCFSFGNASFFWSFCSPSAVLFGSIGVGVGEGFRYTGNLLINTGRYLDPVSSAPSLLLSGVSKVSTAKEIIDDLCENKEIIDKVCQICDYCQ